MPTESVKVKLKVHEKLTMDLFMLEDEVLVQDQKPHSGMTGPTRDGGFHVFEGTVSVVHDGQIEVLGHASGISGFLWKAEFSLEKPFKNSPIKCRADRNGRADVTNHPLIWPS